MPGRNGEITAASFPKRESRTVPRTTRFPCSPRSDGDGATDKKQVFYEGLELVTGFVFYKDGVIVTQAPDILWIRDTDGDGKADKVEALYHGLGTNDTHAVINNPRWGMDGWIYATHGYSSSRERDERRRLEALWEHRLRRGAV